MLVLYNTFAMPERQYPPIVAEIKLIEELASYSHSPQERARILKAFGEFREKVVGLDYINGLVVGFDREQSTVSVLHLLKESEWQSKARTLRESYQEHFERRNPLFRDLDVVSGAYMDLAISLKGIGLKVFTYAATAENYDGVTYQEAVKDSSVPLLFISSSNSAELISEAA